MKRRILPLGVSVIISGVTFLACSDEAPVPSGPSNDIKPPSPSRITPTNPVMQRAPSDGVDPHLFIVFPGDSTTDPCFGGEYCGVQGRAAGGQAVIFCPNGPGTCPDHRYRWSIENPPPNTTTTFDPEVTVNEQVTTFFINTDSTTLPGTYQPVIVSTLDDIVTAATTSTAYTADTIPVRIRCNFRFKSCPEIEIVDLAKGPDSVVSAPKPKQTTLIGKHVQLGLRWKSGTGTGTYSIVQAPAPPPPYQWSMSGTIIKSYDITTGRLDSLRLADRQADTVSYYYAQVSSTNTVYAVATLVRDDNRQVSFPEATASYNAQGPTSVTMTSITTPLGVRVGPTLGDTSKTWLTFGDPISAATAGIQFKFTATAPAGDNGYIAGTQLAKKQTTSTPPGSFLNSGGAYWLDGCPVYDTPQTGISGPPGVNKQFLWQSNDSPGTELTAAFDLLTRTDDFQMYFMYRPGGTESIWVPIGKLDWFWQGTASRTDTTGNNHGWAGPTDAASSRNPIGAPSSTFPQWGLGQVFPSAASCPTLPTS